MISSNLNTNLANLLATKKEDSMTTNKLLGRATTGTWVIEEITLGTGLSYTGTTLNVAAGTWDMTLASAQTNTWVKTFLDLTLGLRNFANTFTSFFTNTNTASRTYTLQDRNGTLADNTDLALKANLASPTFTGTVGGITKAMVWLTSVDDTSDIAKPVSAAQQTALNLKQDTSGKDATGGYTGLTLFKINFKNAANTFTNFLTNTTSAARTYTFPDKDITVAWIVDITGVNSGTNTGDETTARINTLYWAVNAITVGSIELWSATDTTISRVSAWVIAVEGVTLPSISSISTLTNKTLTTPNIASIKWTLTTDTDWATVTFDKNVSDVHNVVLAGNRILALSNMVAGDRIILRLTQDAVGARTVTWFATIKWAGGTVPTLTATVNKADMFWFLCTSAWNFDWFIIWQNI